MLRPDSSRGILNWLRRDKEQRRPAKSIIAVMGKAKAAAAQQQKNQNDYEKRTDLPTSLFLEGAQIRPEICAPQANAPSGDLFASGIVGDLLNGVFGFADVLRRAQSRRRFGRAIEGVI